MYQTSLLLRQNFSYLYLLNLLFNHKEKQKCTKFCSLHIFKDRAKNYILYIPKKYNSHMFKDILFR